MDWSSIALPIITCAITILGVGLSHFKPEERRTKTTLFALAIILTAAQSGAQIWIQQQASAKTESENTRRSEIRKNLAKFILQANYIMQKLSNSKENSAFAEADEWNNTVYYYIKNNLGENYAVRFNDFTGSNILTPTSLVNDENRLGYWRGIYYRDARLVQFSSEFSP